jgi:hypothetical protein
MSSLSELQAEQIPLVMMFFAVFFTAFFICSLLGLPPADFSSAIAIEVGGHSSQLVVPQIICYIVVLKVLKLRLIKYKIFTAKSVILTTKLGTAKLGFSAYCGTAKFGNFYRDKHVSLSFNEIRF